MALIFPASEEHPASIIAINPWIHVILSKAWSLNMFTLLLNFHSQHLSHDQDVQRYHPPTEVRMVKEGTSWTTNPFFYTHGSSWEWFLCHFLSPMLPSYGARKSKLWCLETNYKVWYFEIAQNLSAYFSPNCSLDSGWWAIILLSTLLLTFASTSTNHGTNKWHLASSGWS